MLFAHFHALLLFCGYIYSVSFTNTLVFVPFRVRNVEDLSQSASVAMAVIL
ncbi:Uncharacterised protein [Klebsiella pneumoniae]|nr:Uncharacterised protein [Klebsiella pneumoniae]